MCRMICSLGKEFKLQELIEGLILMANNQIQIDERNKRGGLGTLKHRDGWGVVFLDENNNWTSIKSTLPISEDPKIKDIKNISTTCAILHARKASKGEIRVENLHPFLECDSVFCHNGTIKEKITFNKNYSPRGQTDSERLFYSLIALKENEVKEEILKYTNFSAINSILSTKKKTMITIRYSKNPLHYNMFSLSRKNQIIFSSEYLVNIAPKESWKEWKNNTFLSINNHSLNITQQ